MTPFIDFKVDSNVYHLSVSDFSDWDIISDKPSIIEITLPGEFKPITKYFQKGKINIYNSFDLDVNCVDECGNGDIVGLPDGIYKIKVIGSPSSFNQEYYYLKTDLFDMDLDRVFIENVQRINKENISKSLLEVLLMMRGAKAHVRHELISEASQLFEASVNMVEHLKIN